MIECRTRRQSPVTRPESARQFGRVRAGPEARLDLDVRGAGPMSGRCRSGGRECRCALVLQAVGSDDCRLLEGMEGQVQAKESLPNDLRDGRDALQDRAL